MEFPGEFLSGVPVVLGPQRPYRNRSRHASERHNRQQFYIQDADGHLIPAISPRPGAHRSHSASSPISAPIVINNPKWEDASPERRSRRRSCHHHSSEDEWDDRPHSHERHRPRSRGRGHRAKSRTPSPMDHEMKKRMQKLADLERREEEETARKRFEEQRIIEDAKKAKEAMEREAFKKLAIEEHNAKMLEEELKTKKKKEEEDNAFQQRMRETLTKAGYSEDSIERALKGKGDDGDKGHGKEIMKLPRPTYIKVHRKHLSPDTLELYELPWEWDERDSNYIVIKRWIPEQDQDILFEHTRKLREGRVPTNPTPTPLIEVKKHKDNLLLVRKKSPSRQRSRSRSRAYIFT